jgi:hypothetical protein
VAVSGTDSNEDANPENVVIVENTLTEFSAAGAPATGVTISGDPVDVSRVTVTRNNLDVPLDIDNKASEPLNAQLNYFGGGLSIRGNVAFDPLLTTSIDNIDAESTSEITEYGSLIALDNDGGENTLAVGFSAPSDVNASELFRDIGIEEGTAYTYENDGEGYRDINGSFTPSAGDVIVITTDDPVNEGVIVPIDTSIDGAAANPESVEVENGWNLVATGAADSVDGIPAALDGGSIQDATQIQAQPRQPGLAGAPSRYGAFEATWIFVNGDGEITTGYAENQGANLYNEEVLYPEGQLAEIDGAQIPEQIDDEGDS